MCGSGFGVIAWGGFRVWGLWLLGLSGLMGGPLETLNPKPYAICFYLTYHYDRDRDLNFQGSRSGIKPNLLTSDTVWASKGPDALALWKWIPKAILRIVSGGPNSITTVNMDPLGVAAKNRSSTKSETPALVPVRWRSLKP